MPRSSAITLEVEGIMETIRATRGLEADLRKEADGELRDAAGSTAAKLAASLPAAAASSGVPVARRVAQSVKVKRDRIPVVSIGGAMKVGVRGGKASALVWGSEHGGRGEVNHFGVPSGSGYWIKPAVDRFARSGAVDDFKRAVAAIIRKWGLD